MLYSPVLRNWLKFLLGWATCFVFRLLPHRIPNVEPILATVMPFSERMGVWAGMVFAGASIVFYDILLGMVGLWTWVTAAAYMLVSAIGTLFLRRNKGGVLGYMAFAVIGTLVYDGITGLAIGPLFYGQPFMEALVGQIPFTINHVLGNLVFAAVLSPILYRWVADNRVLEYPFCAKPALQ